MNAHVAPTHIVGIGASAGGLAALEEFFAAMPIDSGMAFVVVQHLSPDFKSLMDDLLARHTKMPIHRVENGLELQANSIYLIPPRQVMTVADGCLYLQERDPQHLVLPVDVFFESLATAAKEQAIGIILSGTGSDGSRGIQAIHESGGLVLAQTIESAQFDGMPRASINTSMCDYVLTPADMPALLTDYARNPDEVRISQTELKIVWDEGEFSEIFAHLRQGYGLDFSKYKPATVGRRITRRLSFRQLEKLSDYVQLLATDDRELDALYHDLLIGVTEFFRDPDTFAYLEREVIPALFNNSGPEGIRVWVAACATGEEAYSLAILLDEHAQKIGYPEKISVFATDVHRKSLDIASQGSYAVERLHNVSAAHLSRYFTPEGPGHYKVVPKLRKMVIFAPHNLISDPPFTRMNMVCCRNLLIYFSTETQEKSISAFNFSLRMDGILFLGSSEGLGKYAEDFATIHTAYKIFRKQQDVRFNYKLSSGQNRTTLVPFDRGFHSRTSVMIDRQLMHDYDLLLKRHIPTGVLLTEGHQVLHYFGDINQYLKPPEGRAETNFVQMVLDELHLAVSMALQRADSLKGAFRLPNVAITRDQNPQRVDVLVEYLPDEKSHSSHYLVVFNPAKELNLLAAVEKEPEVSLTDLATSQALQTHIASLEMDLQLTKENLQATVEELQTSNEELQATNEELLAANEELQSTNEELHSLNEELYTVNAEFEQKNVELQMLNDDLVHLLASLEVGVIFLDDQLSIRRFNPASATSFKLLPQDIGRPLEHIAYQLADQAELITSVREVLQTGKMLEKEVRAHGGMWLLQRILPYINDKRTVTGVILTFTDVTKIKNDEIRLRTLFELLPVGVTILDKDRKIIDSNPSIEQTLSLSHEALLHGNYAQRRYIRNDGSTMPIDEFASARIIREKKPVYDVETGIIKEDDSLIWTNVSGAPLPDGGMVIVTADITARKQAETAARQSEMRLTTVINSAMDALISVDAEQRVVIFNPAAEAMFGYRSEEVMGQPLDMFIPERFRDVHHSHVAKFGETHITSRSMGNLNALWGMRRSGEEFPIEASISHTEQNGQHLFTIILRDVTERKRAEEELRRWKDIFQNVAWGIVVGDPEGKTLELMNPAFAAMHGYTIEEFTGTDIVSVFAPEARAELPGHIRLTHENGRHAWESQHIRKDGTIFPVLVDASVVKDKAGNVLYRIVGVQDITKRKLAEEKLQELNQSLEARVQTATAEIQDLYNHAPGGYQSVDAEGRIIFVNETELSWLGRTREQVLGHLFTEFIVHPQHVEKFKTVHLPALLAGETVSDMEYELLRQDGSTISVMINATPVLNEAGQFIRSRATLVDMTERKKAENALRENLKRVNALHTISQGGIDANDLPNLLKLVADTLSEALSADRVNILCMDIPNKRIELTAKSGPGVEEIVEISFEEAWEGLSGWVLREQKIAWSPAGVPDERESPAVQQRRRETHAGDIIVVPLIFKGNLLGTITIIGRPGDTKFSEEDLALSQAIANQVAVVIEHIRAETNLRLANMELEKAVRVKDEFLASISHELRTPLTGILGLTESMQLETYGKLTARQQQTLQVVESSGRHLLELINDLLDLSKIEAGKFEIHPESISLESVCQSSLNFVKDQARKKSIQLVYQPELQVQSILADPRRLKQILVNLLSNAVKFTQENGRVTLTVHADEEAGQLHFSVVDTGIGIAQEDLERLFTPFTQVDSRLNRKYEGSGLGLALVLRLAEMQGGNVSVASEVGRGSRFTISLPWQKSTPTEASLQTHTGELILPAQPDNVLGVILLVDDNHTNIEVVSGYLEFVGYKVLSAANGLEGVALAKQHSPQLILMDIQMPVMDGLEAISQLRLDSRFAATPIIALTALAMTGDRERCLLAGATEYVSKPVKLKELAALIEKLLG